MNKILTVFDDKEPLNNVINELTLKAGEIFYIYHHDVPLGQFRSIEKVIRRYQESIIHFIRLEDDIRQIEEIIDNNPDIILDVGGAKYLSLLLFEIGRNRNNLIIYYDDEENNIKSYRDHSIITEAVFRLQIEDVLNIRGGEIKDYMHEAITDEASRETLIRIVENNIDNYGSFVHYITKLNSILNSCEYKGHNAYKLDSDAIRNITNDVTYKKREDLFEIEEDTLTFKTRKLRELTSVAGAFLENYLFIRLKESNYFDDIKMSAVIDFADDKYRHPVRCEIDCLVIKDNHLLFVSCKSTKAETETLNEIYVHNKRFGNVLSSAVLCVGEDLDRKGPSIYAKGEELSIFIADRSSFINDDIARVFLSMFDGTYQYDDLD